MALDLNLRVLRYFLTVAETGNFGRAAALLHIATPSLSQQIAALEGQLGVRLLDRDHRGARLTPIGREFVGSAQRLLAESEAAQALVSRYRREQDKKLVVGTSAGGAGSVADPILDRFRILAPDATVELVPVALGDEVSALLREQVDAIFARPPLRTDVPLDVLPILQERRVVVMRQQHALAKLKSLHWRDLSGVAQLDTDLVEDDWRRAWSLDPRPDGTRPTYGPVVRGLDEAYEVIAHSDVVGITAESIATLYRRLDCCWRPLRDVELLEVVLAAKTGHRSPGLLDALKQATLEICTSKQAAQHDLRRPSCPQPNQRSTRAARARA